MAKLALKLRDQKRRQTVEKFKARRAQLLDILHDSRASDEAREEARESRMISSSCARLALNFSTVLRRFWSRSLSASLAMVFSQCLNGKRNAASSDLASSSDFAVVVMAMFMPRSMSILS